VWHRGYRKRWVPARVSMQRAAPALWDEARWRDDPVAGIREAGREAGRNQQRSGNSGKSLTAAGAGCTHVRLEGISVRSRNAFNAHAKCSASNFRFLDLMLWYINRK
jgi:cobalamin biosynthesis protein CobD/CbiB